MAHKPMGRVYVIEYEDVAVKIGYSKDIRQRFESIENYRGNGHSIQRVYVSRKTNDALWVEHCIHMQLTPIEKREIFAISFNDAINLVQRTMKIIEKEMENAKKELESMDENVIECHATPVI